MAITHNVLHRDGTVKMYVSPATPGQYLTFTSRGDDIQNKIIGAGNQITITNESNSLEVIKEVQFIEDIQLKDAYVFWQNAKIGDYLIGEVILPANIPYPNSKKTGNAEIIDNVIQSITTSSTPDDTWTGSYNLFPVDVPIIRFLNNMPLYGSNNIGTILESPGVALVSKELKSRLIYKRYDSTPNPDINISVMLELYREHTI